MSSARAHLIASITPRSAAMAAARAADGPLAAWVAGARHAARPRLERRAVMCVLADHGVVDPGVDLGAEHPTVVAARALTDGSAALATAARAASATLVVIDAGLATAAARPSSLIAVADRSSGDLATGAALTPVEVGHAIDSGIAVTTALSEVGLDLLALGGLGLGADLAAAAVIAALTGGGAALAPADGQALVAAGLATLPPGATPLDVLAAVGGRDIGFVVGAILAAAAQYIPIVLDGTTALAGALVAARLAPASRDYLALAHGGGGPAAVAAGAALELTPIVSAGLGHGEGVGAALVLPLLVR